MEADKELLIYDLQINKAYNLNETSKIDYKACDGKISFDELKRAFQFTDDLIYFALDEFKANNLIEGEVTDHFAGYQDAKWSSVRTNFDDRAAGDYRISCAAFGIRSIRLCESRRTSSRH